MYNQKISLLRTLGDISLYTLKIVRCRMLFVTRQSQNNTLKLTRHLQDYCQNRKGMVYTTCPFDGKQ